MELTKTNDDLPTHPAFGILRRKALDLVANGKKALTKAKEEIEARRVVLHSTGLGLNEAGVMAKAQFLAEHGDEIMQIKADLLAQVIGKSDDLEEMNRLEPEKRVDRMSRIAARSVKTIKEFEQFLDLATTHPSLDQKGANFTKVDARQVIIPPEEGGQRLKDIVESEPVADVG